MHPQQETWVSESTKVDATPVKMSDVLNLLPVFSSRSSANIPIVSPEAATVRLPASMAERNEIEPTPIVLDNKKESDSKPGTQSRSDHRVDENQKEDESAKAEDTYQRPANSRVTQGNDRGVRRHVKDLAGKIVALMLLTWATMTGCIHDHSAADLDHWRVMKSFFQARSFGDLSTRVMSAANDYHHDLSGIAVEIKIQALSALKAVDAVFCNRMEEIKSQMVKVFTIRREFFRSPRGLPREMKRRLAKTLAVVKQILYAHLTGMKTQVATLLTTVKEFFHNHKIVAGNMKQNVRTTKGMKRRPAATLTATRTYFPVRKELPREMKARTALALTAVLGLFHYREAIFRGIKTRASNALTAIDGFFHARTGPDGCRLEGWIRIGYAALYLIDRMLWTTDLELFFYQNGVVQTKVGRSLLDIVRGEHDTVFQLAPESHWLVWTLNYLGFFQGILLLLGIAPRFQISCLLINIISWDNQNCLTFDSQDILLPTLAFLLCFLPLHRRCRSWYDRSR